MYQSKSISFLLIVLAISADSISQRYTTAKYTLSISAKYLNKKIKGAYLIFKDNGNDTRDSAKMKDGTTYFTGKISEPVRAALVLIPSSDALDVDGKKPIKGFPLAPKNQFYFFLDSGNTAVNIKEPLITSTFQGSKAQEEYVQLTQQLEPLNNRKEALFIKFIQYDSAKNNDGIKEVESEILQVDEEIKLMYKEYVQMNPSSKLVAYALSRYALAGSKLKDVEPLLKNIPTNIKRSYSITSLIETMGIKERTSVGAVAADFSLPGISGKPVSLVSFRGKYVLVDFWGSWCGPCRGENPNLVKAYDRFGKKQFTILSVSLEKEGGRTDWLNAIKADHLTWNNVYDQKFFDSHVAKMYGITSVPYNLLIDPDGKIISKNLRGDALIKKLSEVLQ